MKKITFAVLALMASGSALASSDIIEFAPGTPTEAANMASNYSYEVADTRAERDFVKNSFNFTLSANTILDAAEDDDGRYMGVVTANVRGRNIFTGHSDGGSVTSCGDPLTAAEAKEAGAHVTEFSRFDVEEVTNGACSED